MDKNNDTFKKNMCFYIANILDFYIPNNNAKVQMRLKFTAPVSLKSSRDCVSYRLVFVRLVRIFTYVIVTLQ